MTDPTEARAALLLAVEEVDNAWNDQGDHIEWDSDVLPERLIALRKALAALPDDGREGLRERIEAAAVLACKTHFDERHVVLIEPCAEARQDAEWWAEAFALTDKP